MKVCHVKALKVVMQEFVSGEFQKCSNDCMNADRGM
jgi:hypothetical protein